MSRAARPRPSVFTAPLRAFSAPSQRDITASGAARTAAPSAARPAASSQAPRRGLTRAAYSPSGSTLTTRPRRPLVNWTVPAARA